jgi:hypothetical protein
MQDIEMLRKELDSVTADPDEMGLIMADIEARM